MHFQIKEVRIPIEFKGHITDKEPIIVFYPQIQLTSIKRTGQLWWSKTTEVTGWYSFYLLKNGRLINGLIYKSLSGDDGQIVSCPSIEEAKKVCLDYENKCIQRQKERYINNAHYWDDEKLVKIHPLEDIE